MVELKRLIRKTAGVMAMPIPLKTLTSLSGRKLILPFYHAVSDQRIPHLANVLTTRDIPTFRKDLDFFLRHFDPVGADTLLHMAKGEVPLKKPSFHLTFDDGLKEVITVVAPILKEKGIPATFFVNTGFIGNRDLFYRFKASLLIEKLRDTPESLNNEVALNLRHRLEEGGTSSGNQQAEPSAPDGRQKAAAYTLAGCRKAAPFERTGRQKGAALEPAGRRPDHSPTLKNLLLRIGYANRELLDEAASLMQFSFKEYLTSHEVYLDMEEIRQLLSMGFTIGAHSHDHPEFRQVSPEEQLRQATESIRFLKENFHISPCLFSFPFSDEEVPKSLFERLYPPEGGIDLTFGISGLKGEEFPGHLHRIPMETGADPASRMIKGEYLYYLLKAPFNKNLIIRK